MKNEKLRQLLIDMYVPTPDIVRVLDKALELANDVLLSQHLLLALIEETNVPHMLEIAGVTDLLRLRDAINSSFVNIDPIGNIVIWNGISLEALDIFNETLKSTKINGTIDFLLAILDEGTSHAAKAIAIQADENSLKEAIVAKKITQAMAQKIRGMQ